MTDIPQLPDGLFLNLPEEVYFGQIGRMGSSDLAALFLRGPGYWWSSDMNPDRPNEDDDTPAKEFGKGLHAIILEGEDVYASRVATYPDKDVERKKHGKNFCVTVKDIMEGLEARGFNPKANQGKDFLVEYSRSRAPDLIMWDTLAAAWELANKGKIKVTDVEDRQIRIMAAAVRNHPEIGPLFQFGPEHVPLSEVSIFWTDEHGLRRRARLDQMLPQTIIDLKTLQNTSGRPLSFAAGDHVAKYAYYVQLADHHVARKYAYRFIGEGKVHDGVPKQDRDDVTDAKFERELAWIKRFPAEAPHWDYCWLQYVKPDAKKGIAPIIFPWGEDYGSPLHMQGIRARRQAIQTYRECLKQFGPDTPWIRVEPLHNSDENNRLKHRVFLPAWIGGQDPMPGEEEDL